MCLDLVAVEVERDLGQNCPTCGRVSTQRCTLSKVIAHMGTEHLPDSEKECWCLMTRDSSRSQEVSLDWLELVDDIVDAQWDCLTLECTD